MEQKCEINSEFDFEFGLPELDPEECHSSKKIDYCIKSKLQIGDEYSDRDSTNCSSFCEGSHSVRHFKNFHPIDEKFMKIKLRSVPLSVRLDIDHDNNWKLSDECFTSL